MLSQPRVYGLVVAPGSEDRREFHMTDVIRIGLPSNVCLRPARIRDHPRDDTTVKLKPETADSRADAQIAAQGSATGQRLRAKGPDQRDAHRRSDDPAPVTAAREGNVVVARKLIE